MRKHVSFLLPCALTLLVLSSCSSEKKEPVAEVAKTPEAAKEAPKSEVPDVYKVRMDTSKGIVLIEVTKQWAPLGAQRFYELVKDKFYDDARFFRVVPNFVAQFGLAANPAMTKKWDRTIPDDPVIRANVRGSLVFATAGPNTRTTQLFINLRSNQSLDSQGFAPFGRVIEGMEVVDRFFQGYGERPDQGAATASGNVYLKSQFPNLDYIRTATIVQ